MKRLLVIVVVVFAAAGFGFWYWFIRDTAPPPATLTNRGTVKPASGPDGSYHVQSGATTFAGFRIEEDFTVGHHTAVVRTPKVSGTLTLSGRDVNAVSVTADLTQLDNKDSQPPGVPGLHGRLSSLQFQGLEIARFPDARFVLSQPIVLSTAPRVGAIVAADAHGKLTLHGVTRDVTVPVKARWNGAVIDVNGHLPVRLSDYSIIAPSRPFVAVGPNGTMEFDLTFAK